MRWSTHSKSVAGRTAKARRNIYTGLITKFLTMFLAFATRTIFIRLLGAEYTGINSLYTNILSVLSLAELGLGNVLMFYLYSALKEGDKEKINQLVFEFKRIYTIIISAVLLIGVGLIPFLHIIVKSNLNKGELIVYYLLYLLNSVASYAVAYRTMVLSADQKNYISNVVGTATIVAMYVFQTLYLLVFKAFIGYLVIQVLCTIANNLILNIIALKRYPFLKTRMSNSLILIDRKDLVENIKATFLFKLSDTLLDQTDSVLISGLIGTIYVGYYYNYYMLITYMVSIAGILANGLVASFGNLVAEGVKEKSYEMFKVSLLVFSMFGTISTCCYSCIVQDFVPIWIGKEYVMDYGLVIALMSVYYLRISTNTIWIYRSAMGLFKEVKYSNAIAATINIVLSIILGKAIGLVGIIAATAISRLVTTFWYEGKIVFKRFSKPVAEYYLRQLLNFAICCFCLALSVYLCRLVSLTGLAGMICKLGIAFAISTAVECLVYYRTKEFKKIYSSIVKRPIS